MTPAMLWTVQTINSLVNVGYTGKIELNFFQGGVTGVNFSQSVKPLQDVNAVLVAKELV